MNAARILKDVADATVGFVGKMTPHYRDEGVTFLRSQDVRPHRIDVASALKVDPEFEARIRKSRLRAGDVVVVRTGKPGTSAVVPPELEGANCSDLVVIRPGPELSSEWLSYYINAAAQGFVRERLVGAVQQHFNVKSALEMPVPVLSLSVQEAQASVLGALDDKIAANRRLGSSLWQMVDAKARFASSVEPKFVALGSFVRLNYGRALPVARRRSGEVTVMGSGGEVGRHDEALVPGPSVIVGRKGSVGATYWVDGPAYPIDTTYWVEPVGVPLLYAYTVLKSIDFSGMSTDSAVPGLNRDRAYAIPVALPSPERLRTFELCTASLVERAAAANDENRRLAATRDELLPLLMSGKITVKDAEKTVEEVV